MVWLTAERRLALFPAGTIFRDPHHCKIRTRREQGEATRIKATREATRVNYGYY